MIRENTNDINLIKVSELLEIFDLDLNLSNELLNIEVDACLKSSKLSVNDNSYEFKFEDYIVTINPYASEQTVVEDTGKFSPSFFYNSKGILYKLN